VGGIHNVWTGRLRQIVKFARDGTIIKIQFKSWLVLVRKQNYVCLGRHWLGNSVLQPNIFNYGFDQCSLSELNSTSLKSFDINSNVVSRVTLILNLESQALELSYN
jgi:hypothetical protein